MANRPSQFTQSALTALAALGLAACGGSDATSDADAGLGGSTGGSTGGTTGGTTGGDTGGAITGGDTGGTTGGTTGGDTGGAGGDTGGGGGAGGEQPPGACGDVPLVVFGADAVEEDDGSLSQLATTGEASASDGSCVESSGSEVAFEFTAPEAATYRFYSGAVTEGIDTILYARDTCADGETELACNDDVDYAGGLYDSRIWFDLEAGQTVYVIVDAYPLQDGPQSGEVFLNVKTIDRADRGGECDRLVLDTACPDTDFCYTEIGEDGAFADLGVCAEDTVPALVSAEAFGTDTTVGYVVSGTDSSRDTLGIHVIYQFDDMVLETPDGFPAEDYLGAFEGSDPYGLESFTLRAGQDYAVDFGIEAPNKVTIALVDSMGNESEAVTVDIAPAPAVVEGMPCDEFRLTDACVEGTACRTDEGSEPATWSCQAIKAPELTAATAYYNAANGHIAVVFEGLDSEKDVDAPGITILDPEGVDIPLRGDGEIGEALGEFEPFEYGELGEFRAVWEFILTDEAGVPLQIGTVRVRAHDAEGLISESVDATLMAPVADLPAGEPCDDWLAMNLCAEGLGCPTPDPEAEIAVDPVCTEVPVECPADYGVTALEGAGPSWTISGDTTGATAHTRGTCGGGSGDAVFSFTAPEAGTYTFTTTSDDPEADTVLYLRAACGAGPEFEGFELACNDDPEAGNTLAAASVALEAAQTVYVFVDGYMGAEAGWTGPFSLTVTRE
jgi:hypothetical protein